MAAREQPVVDFYFDYSCPWTWFAMVRLREAALRTAAKINWCPVLIDQVLELANPGYPRDRTDPNPRKAAWQKSDLNAWARFCGLRVHRPPGWPRTSEWAQRGAVVALESGRIVPYSEAVFAASFTEGLDISGLPVVTAAATSAGLDEAAFTAALQDEGTLLAVRQNSQRLVERGGFGTPSMFVGDELFFGNDRMPLVEMTLNRISDFQLIAPGQHGI